MEPLAPELLRMEPFLWDLVEPQLLRMEPCGTSTFKNGAFTWNLVAPEL